MRTHPARHRRAGRPARVLRLVGGQSTPEGAFELDSGPGIVVEMVSGVAFLTLLVRGEAPGAVLHQGSPDVVMTPDVLRDVFDVDVTVHRLDGRPVAVYYS